MELSEDGLVAAIRTVLSGETSGVIVGLGDDAAVVEPGTGSSVLTTDLLVDGVHFERGSTSARDLGAKAIAVNVSDIAAMGASPRYALASLALPSDIEAAWVVELYGGMRAACDEYALALVGGDLSRAERLVISVMVLGEVSRGHAVTREGARAGDAIVVTGSLGAAAAGLALSRAPAPVLLAALSAGWARELLDALARPAARVGEGVTLAQCGATAMMDLSDGVAKDLSRLCIASGVGARVRLADVPIPEAVRAAAAALAVDPLDLAISGGEDYELLATIAPTEVDGARERLRDRFGLALTRVGDIVEGQGLVAVDAHGAESTMEPKGWDHFAG
ncbi:MAG: thiamine-phosphate kinase [Actinomycetota bacterium]